MERFYFFNEDGVWEQGPEGLKRVGLSGIEILMAQTKDAPVELVAVPITSKEE